MSTTDPARVSAAGPAPARVSATADPPARVATPTASTGRASASPPAAAAMSADARARLVTRLGRTALLDAAGRPVTFNQRGDVESFDGSRADGFAITGSGEVAATGRIEPPARLPLEGDTPIDEGHITFGQSTSQAATETMAGTGDPVAFHTVLAPVEGRVWMANGGVEPHQGGVAANQVTVALSAAQIASFVAARAGANPLVQRENPLLAMAETVACALPQRDHVYIGAFGHGSCTFEDVIYGSIGGGQFGEKQPVANAKLWVAAAMARSAARGRRFVLRSVNLIGFESADDTQFVSQAATKLGQFKTVRDSFKALTGQTEDIFSAIALMDAPRTSINQDPPANATNNPPDLSNMGGLSLWAVACEQWCRDAANNAACFAQYDQAGWSVASVHWKTAAYPTMGQKMGRLYVGWRAAGGVRPLHAYALRARRVVNSRGFAVSLSEAARFETTAISDDGQKGLAWRDSAGARAISAVEVSGTTVSGTLATLPNGASEKLYIAAGNATKFSDWAYRNGDGQPPYDAPTYGRGPTDGQRTNLVAVTDFGTDLRTGARIVRGFVNQVLDVEVYSDAPYLAGIAAQWAEGGGPAARLLLDARDPAGYVAGSQQLVDGSAGATHFVLGKSASVEAIDPAVTGGQIVFDGSSASQCLTLAPGVSIPAWLADLHKATGEVVFAGILTLPASNAATMHVLANCRDAGGTGAGFALRVTTAAKIGLTIRSATGSALVNVVPAAALTRSIRRPFMLGYSASLGRAWFRCLEAPTEAITFTASGFATGAAEAGPAIGRNGASVADVNASRFTGAACSPFSAWPWGEPETFDPLFNTLVAACED